MKFLQFAPFLLLSLLLSCSKNEVGMVEKEEEPIQVRPDFAKGADVGWITEMEAQGIKFYNNNGTATEAMALLKSLGMNTIRLRVWVNPSPRYNDANDVLVKAKRAKTLGMRIMINFHYSDSWADPGQQTKPAAWANLDVEGLKKAITTHTQEVLTLLKTNGIIPEWVQIGNETNNGMLWPEGRASTNMANFAAMINASSETVKSIFPTTKVIVHISNGWDNSLFRWIFDGLKANHAKFDVIGISLYPSASNWQMYNSQCVATMTDMISRYQKEVMVVEVGMLWYNSAECNLFLRDLMAKTNALPDKKGLGVLYWEPMAYNNWKGYSLGAFDDSGKPTEAMKAFAN